MNIAFTFICLSSIILLIITKPELVLSCMISGANGSLELAFTLLCIYCVWLSVLKLMETLNINKYLSALLMPITRRLFKGEDAKTLEYINLNFSANILGMGGIATPLGIKAVESSSINNERISDNILMFVVINCTSIQLLPTTIIGLRAGLGSISPSDIILPSILATTISTIIGILLCKLCAKIFK